MNQKVILKRRHPDWLKVKIPSGENYNRIKSILSNNKIHTICGEAKCPNIAECWSKGTTTFLILGRVCTRNCLYCNVEHGVPLKLNSSESKSISRIVKKLNLKYAVITSVTRDDLKDGGASVFAETIKEVKGITNCKVEVLTPDFNGNEKSIEKVIKAKPDIFAHNMEVVKSLFNTLRPHGNYTLSLDFLKKIKKINPEIKTKSGVMIGFGENKKDIINLMRDLRNVDCEIFTIGQYLQPTKKHYPTKKYYRPEEFEEFKEIGYKLGFRFVYSGPLVRSSYHAEEAMDSEKYLKLRN